MVDPNITDEDLIQRMCDEGNLRLFSILTDRYERKIYRKSYAMVKDNEQAADLTQEILIKIFMQMYGFRNTAKFSTWVHAITYNTCIDFLRKNKSKLKVALTENLADSIAEMIEGEKSIPEDVTLEILEVLLDQLSADEKLIMVLKYKEKHSIKDIMGTLGLSESAVKMRLKRARQRVNDLYATHDQKSKSQKN
jgi:RNA polymerase sigma factor (sigma-70 family)